MQGILLQIRYLERELSKSLKKINYFSFEPHVIRISFVCHSYVIRTSLVCHCLAKSRDKRKQLHFYYQSAYDPQIRQDGSSP